MTIIIYILVFFLQCMQLISLLIDWLLELGKVVKKQMEDLLKAFKVILFV